jgi:N-acetylglutamate synthase-like GNAT family acetyltransferase
MEIRTAERSDHPEMLGLSQGERWLLTEKDIGLMFDAGGRFVVATDKERLVAMASCIPYARYGWLGNIVVCKEARRLGIGRKITQGCIDHLKERGLIPALFAYSTSKRMYQRMGFTECGEYVNYGGYLTSAKLERRSDLRVDTGEIGEISRFDLELWCDDRGLLLRKMAESGTALSIRGDNGLEGYIIGTIERGALYIGPWMARSMHVARALFNALVEREMQGKDPLYVDVSIPSTNTDWIAFIEGMLKMIDNVVEMHLGATGPLKRVGVYGCACLDKG